MQRKYVICWNIFSSWKMSPLKGQFMILSSFIHTRVILKIKLQFVIYYTLVEAQFIKPSINLFFFSSVIV